MKQPHDTWFFTGAKATYGVFNGADAADGQSITPPFTTDLTDSTHGLLAGSCLYIQGTTNYDGLKKIASIPDANSMVIYNKFIAETLAGTETWKVMYSSPHPFEFIGYEIKFNTAPTATSESLVVSLDANFGTAFDVQYDTDTVDDKTTINEYFSDVPKLCMGGDKINFAWANGDAVTWGIKIFTRRLV